MQGGEGRNITDTKSPLERTRELTLEYVIINLP